MTNPLMRPLPVEVLASRPAQVAYWSAIREGKLAAMREITRLMPWGRRIVAMDLVVSIVHLFHMISLIVPEEVSPLKIPDEFHALSSFAFTISIDVTLYFLVTGWAAAAYGGIDANSQGRVVARWFFYVLTGLLNTVFVLNYMPGLPDWMAYLVALITPINAILLGILTPFSLVSLERVIHDLKHAAAQLRVETEGLTGALKGMENETFTMPTVLPDAPTPQRPLLAYPQWDTGHEFTFADFVSASGRSRSQARRLLESMVEQGLVDKVGQGSYRLKIQYQFSSP